ncbi:MAG: V-type ATPase 116kDa subunit family protein [Pseudomonadota bacterium]|nr:V-type ATPase 116kDa subunit family protein [Pseudomonadota bacterium]
MSLRPVSARWFELLTTRDDLTAAVETLARTGRVELETQSGIETRFNMPDLHQRMEEYNRLSHRYHAYWPKIELDTSSAPGSPVRIVDKALTQLRAWVHDAAPIVQDLEAQRGKQHDLTLLSEMLGAQQDNELDYSLLANAGPVMFASLFVLPPDSKLKALPGSLLIMRTPTASHDFILAVGPGDDLDALSTDLSILKGRRLLTPKWLHGDCDVALKQVNDRLAGIENQLEQLHEKLTALTARHQLAKALGDIRRMDWFMTHIKSLAVSENFAWLTGWTSDLDGNQINAALARNDIHSLVHFPHAPEDCQPPMVMKNPWWAQPFELFANLLGTPSQDEADPSRVLAVMVPLLFGYMFGDVGQGLVILLAGLLLKRRWPIAKILVVNGFAAMIFGVVFGSVFGSENVIAPLWVHPVEQPLPVLMVPLAGGVVILLLGLMLNAAASWWQGKFVHWLQVEAAIVVLYGSLIASYFSPGSLYISLLALIWYLIGSVLQSPHAMLKTISASIGSLLENLFQLLINTVSFVRVGAFALAHAGLSMAFYTMASATNSMIFSFLILLIGNIIIILLEGLVVTIQTTRLVLFEFFIRFLRGTGRMFRPLTAPGDTSHSSQI